MSFGGQTITASYFGITFSERMQTLGIESRTVPDRAGRTVAYVEHTITIRDIINAASAGLADTNMATIKQRLSSPGRDFTYRNGGWGNVVVNQGTVRDVAWGPWPRVLSWKPLADKAAEITWTVTVRVPECSNAVYAGAFMEFNFALSFDTDRAGYTTRTMTGYYTIPQTRVAGGRNLIETADDYWERVQPELPEGWQRVVNRRQLDESKCRCEFELVDEQRGPNYLPEGIVECRASHTLGSTAIGMTNWGGTIDAHYICAADFAPDKCAKLFIQLVKDRIDYTRQNLKPIDPNDKVNNFSGFVLPMRLEMSEPDIFGRPEARFSFQYVLTQNLSNILKASALWKPVNNNWQLWKTSLKNSALHPRGSSQMRVDRRDDVIIDLCIPRNQIQLKTEQRQEIQLRTAPDLDLCGECPKPQDSWLFYDIKIQAEDVDNVIEHKPLPKKISPGDVPANTPASSFFRASGGNLGAPDSVTQRRGDNAQAIYIIGTAARVCYDIPPPEIKMINYRPVTKANRDGKEYFETRVATDLGCHAIIVARFKQRYIIPTRRDLKTGPLTAVPAPGLPREVRLSTQYEVQLKTTDPFPGQ